MAKLNVRAIREISELEDLHRAMPLREHYQRCLQIGESIELVADRVWHSAVKEA
jgi:hypothetical protein